MTKLSGQEILITDSPASSKGSHLNKVNIESGVSELLQVSKTEGVGIYKIISSPDFQHILIISSDDWITTELKIVNINDLNTPLWNKHLSFPLHSAAFDNNKISFKNEQSGIDFYEFDGDFNVINFTDIPILAPFYNLTLSPNGILFTQGEFYSQSIAIYNMSSHNKTEFPNPRGVRNRLPYRYNENKILFVSNKTGMHQLWSKSLTDNITHQISHFNHIKRIETLEVSNDNQFILIGADEIIHLYHFNQYKLEQAIITFEGRFPVFHGERIIFSKHKNKTYNLFSYDLKNRETTQLTKFGGVEAHIENNLIYFDKYNKPGIWVMNAEQKEELVISLPEHPKRWFVNEDKLYFTNNDTSMFQLNLDSLEIKPFDNKNCQSAVFISENNCISVFEDNVPNQVMTLPYSH